MAKKYFVWKDPACNGKDIEWIELNGRAFYDLLKQPGNKDRRFVRLGNDVCPDADVIFMEATEIQYLEWRKEQNAHVYLSRNNAAYGVVSLDCPFGNQEGESLHDIIAGKNTKVEEAAVESLLCGYLRDVFGQLALDEQALLMDIYADEMTIAQVAREKGVSRQAVSKRVQKLVRKIQKFF